MTTTVIIAPDIYYRNWSEGGTEGEMWLCLRPYVKSGKVDPKKSPLGDNLSDFDAWIARPHIATTTGDGKGRWLYEFKSPNEVGMSVGACGADNSVLPILLPSEIDVVVKVGRGLAETELSLPRQTSCRVNIKRDKDIAEKSEIFLPMAGTIGSPFARAFNEKLGKEISARTGFERLQAIFTLMQELDAGRSMRVLGTDFVANPYPFAGPVIPQPPGTSGAFTSLYWYLGLMVPLGTQAELAKIRSIDRVDIVFKAYGLEQSMSFPGTTYGMESAADYFSKVGIGFTRKLVSSLESRESRIYVSPGFRGMLPVGREGDGRWVLEQPRTDTSPDAREAVREQGGVAQNAESLSRLAAIEVRAKLKKAANKDDPPPALEDIGGPITLRPGLLISGTTKPYRRFPLVPSNPVAQNLRCTVLEFVPDRGLAPLLSDLRKRLTPAEFAAMFKTTETAETNVWELKLLYAGILPWDGPDPLYRIIAVPAKDAKSKPNGPVTFPLQPVSFFFPVPGVVLVARGIVREGLPQGRALWSSTEQWPSASSPDTLAAGWATASTDAWATGRFNAIQVSGAKLAADQLAVNVMLTNLFNMSPAESAVRLEKILMVEGQAEHGTTLASTDFDPLRDFEDDLVNFSTAHLLVPAGAGGYRELDNHSLRRPELSEADPATCVVGHMNRRQSIPLLQAWPRDPWDVEGPQKPVVTWRDIRDSVAKRYDLSLDPEGANLDILLEHTYGDRQAAASADGTRIRVQRSKRMDWPVQIASSVKKPATSSPIGGSPVRFVTCFYDPGAAGARDHVRLTFDLSLLGGSFDPVSKDAPVAYAATLAAWRAIAEIASPGAKVSLLYTIANFDLNRAFALVVQDNGGAQGAFAQALAESGFRGGASRAVGEGEPQALLAAPELASLKVWASELMTAGSPQLNGCTGFDFPVGKAEKLGEIAHLLQVSLRIERSVDVCPSNVADQDLRPISQQPGLFKVSEDSMQATWASLGFGPRAPRLDPKSFGQPGEALSFSQQSWTAARTLDSRSISPEAPTCPSGAALGTATPGASAQTALVAALHGTDWFAPSGPGPRPERKRVRPVLLPLGFAPCRPSGALGNSTQSALQRLGIALRDAIDLAYPGWAERDEAFWLDRFVKIAGLATSNGANTNGSLVTYCAMLVDQLFKPQPDASHAANAQEVRSLAGDIRSGTGDLQWLRTLVARRLLADPGLFADAKALLLTRLDFTSDPTVNPTPVSGAVARAKFQRISGVNPKGGIGGAASSSLVTVDDLVLAGRGESDLDHRLAFLETLDDTKYADRFEIPSSDEYLLESYEQVVDNATQEDEAGKALPPKPSWTQDAIVLPLAAANLSGGKRVVHLASRALVNPPVLLWSGESTDLTKALGTAGAPSAAWSLERLSRGQPGGGAKGETVLKMIARMVPGPFLGPDPVGTAELGTAYALYRIEGDEETEGTVLDSLENDSFFIRLSKSAFAVAQFTSQEAAASPITRTEQQLQALLRSVLGTDDAAAALEALVFPADGHDFSADFAPLVKPVASPLLDDSHALLLIDRTVGFASIRPYGNKAVDTTRLLRHVALFEVAADSTTTPGKPASALTVKSAALLVGFQTSVWTQREIEMTQGRNVPASPWTGATIELRPAFSPEFWVSQPQSSRAARQSISRHWVNSPERWRSASGHVIRLGAGWRLPKSLPELVKEFLLTPGRAIADIAQPNGILTSASANQVLSQELNIQVFHEQFLDDPSSATGPLSRFPLPAKAFVSTSASSQTQIWFDERYDHFSVDFQWLAPSGLSLLRLERMFVRFD